MATTDAVLLPDDESCWDTAGAEERTVVHALQTTTETTTEAREDAR